MSKENHLNYYCRHKSYSIFLGFFLLCMGILHHAIAAPINETNDALIVKNILVYINQYRVEHHLKPLQINHAISEEAKKHSVEMAKHIIPFGHQAFNERIQQLYKQIKQPQAGAENVAYNYKDAQDVVKNWLTSPGHRKNIAGNYNFTGIGIARDKQGKLYYTQIFLRATLAG